MIKPLITLLTGSIEKVTKSLYSYSLSNVQKKIDLKLLKTSTNIRDNYKSAYNMWVSKDKSGNKKITLYFRNCAITHCLVE